MSLAKQLKLPYEEKQSMPPSQMCALTFKVKFLGNPTLDAQGKCWMMLQRQLRGYEDSDPLQKRQACIPLIIFKTLLQEARTPEELAIAQLSTGALFFAMRSCEYTHTSGDSFRGDRKSKTFKSKEHKILS